MPGHIGRNTIRAQGHTPCAQRQKHNRTRFTLPTTTTSSNSSSLTPGVSANVINYSSPGVGENTIDPGVPPLAIGVREQEDILQSIEVPVGGWVTAHQHGFQEGVPLGG